MGAVYLGVIGVRYFIPGHYSVLILSLLIAVFLGCNNDEFSGNSGKASKAAKEPKSADKPRKGEPADPKKQDEDFDADAVYAPDDPDNPYIPPEPAPEPAFDGDNTVPGMEAPIVVNDAGAGGQKPEIPNPAFGMLVNDLQCGLCHTDVYGDILSIDPPNVQTGVKSVWLVFNAMHPGEDKKANVFGRWLNAAKEGEFFQNPFDIRGGLINNYQGPEVTNDLNGDGRPDFPEFSAAKVKSTAKGTLEGIGRQGASLKLKGSHSGGLLISGTQNNPIVIEGEFVVEGDLVIYGQYTGHGTIYVTGNIYIPQDLTAIRTAFPFDAIPATAKKQAQERMTKDALALATLQSTILGYIESPIYARGGMRPVPREHFSETLKIKDVYQWLPKAEFEKTYKLGAGCGGNQSALFNQVDAFLYTKNTIGGSSDGVYRINGGIIADSMHIVTSVSNTCHTGKRSVIAYDWRMSEGLGLLRALAPYFNK